jgi:hypothetical protein
MVKNPAVAGTFDAGVSPADRDLSMERVVMRAADRRHVHDDEQARAPETVRVDAANSLYIVNWHTDQFALTLGGHLSNHGIGARRHRGIGGRSGPANGAAKNVTTGDDIALVDGKTLPIKFRIEQGMVVSVAVTPNPTRSSSARWARSPPCSRMQTETSVANQVVSWSSDNTAVATVDSHGVVTGVSLGTATITASSNGMSGAASVVVVRPPVAAVIVEPATSTVQVGQSRNARRDAQGRRWEYADRPNGWLEQLGSDVGDGGRQRSGHWRPAEPDNDHGDGGGREWCRGVTVTPAGSQ